MAIEESTVYECAVYECICDKCWEVSYGRYGNCSFLSEENLRSDLTRDGWKQINGEWICPDCQEEEEV